MRSTKEHHKQNRGISDGLRSIETTMEEKEEDKDEELILKENGETRVLRGIFSTSDATVCILGFKNSSSTIELEFLKLERLVFQFVLQYDN